MERYAWKGYVDETKIDEYKKRHDNIWSEMKDVLKEAGIVNYTIFLNGNELFGYYECLKGIEYAQKVQNESEVVKRWNEFMSDILVWPDGKTQSPLIPVFRFD